MQIKDEMKQSEYLHEIFYERDMIKAEKLKVCVPMRSCFSHIQLCDPMDSSLPGSFVHGILQARILQWVAISISSWSSWSRDRTQVSPITGRSCIAGRFWATREALGICMTRYTHPQSGFPPILPLSNAVEPDSMPTIPCPSDASDTSSSKAPVASRGTSSDNDGAGYRGSGGWKVVTLKYNLREWSEWKSLSGVWLFATPWTIQAMEFSRPEYWSG